MVGPGALKPKVGDGMIKSRLLLYILHSFILLFFFFVLCVLLHLYWCVYNTRATRTRMRSIYTACVYIHDPPNFSATFHTPKVSDGDFT